MIPTLEDIIRALLDGSMDHETARSYLHAHEQLNAQAEESAGQMTLYRGINVLGAIQRMVEQDARWGTGRDYPNFDAALISSADIGSQDIAAHYHLMSAVNLRRVTEARANLGELTWFDILLEEVGKLTEKEDRESLRHQLIDVAAVSLQWAQARTLIEVNVKTNVGDIKEKVPDGPMQDVAQGIVVGELSTFEVFHNGTRKENIIANDAREAGQMAVRFYGPGEYNVRLLNDDEDGHE